MIIMSDTLSNKPWTARASQKRASLVYEDRVVASEREDKDDATLPEIMHGAALATYKKMAELFNSLGYLPSTKRIPEVEMEITEQLELIEE